MITEAIDLVEPGNPERASSLATRGRLLHRRYEAYGSADDLTAAIADAQAAVDATPGGHPGSASRLSLLASLTALSDDPVTWGRALDLHRQAWATVTSTPGFSGFAVVGIGNALAGTLHAHLEGVREIHVAGDPSDELWRVLTGTLAALEGYLARLPLDADDDALFTVGTYGHLYAWLIDVAVRRVEEANARGDDSVALVREAFAAIERSKGRRVISRLQAGALRPTPAALPLVEALERLKPEIDRLETLLFGGSEPPRPGSEANEYPSGTSLGWLGERLPIAPGLRASRPPRLEERLGTAHAWVPDTDAARQRSDRARMAARHAELQAEFADLLRQIERSDPTYATARGYAAPRSPEAVAQALPRGAVLAVFAPMADRTAVVVVRPSGFDKPRRRMRREMPRRRMRRVEGQQASIALETIAISEAQWVRLVDRTFRHVDGSRSNDGELSLTALDRELEGTLRAVGDRLIPKLATLLPDYDTPRRRTSTRITRRVGDVPHPTSQHLVIVPTGAMHRLPLHAVPWAPAGIARWDGSTRLADRFIVSYASMADVLPLVTPRPVADQGVASIAPGLGLHAHDADPHATVALAAALAREASRATEPDRDEATVALRLGAEASREELLARRVLTGRRFGFVATHGRAGGTVGSGLLVHRGHRHDAQVKPLPPPIPTAENAPSPTLGRQRRETGDGTWVSSAEILARLNLDGVDHLQMLACSTHADDPAPGDHLGSLLTALLICGARSVGGTLWAVDEVAAVLVGYRVGTALIRGEADKAQALRDATQWLRQATGAEIAEVLAELRDAVFERVPNADRVRIALADVVDRFRVHASHASTPPFADVVHWAPYVQHGAPLVGSHG